MYNHLILVFIFSPILKLIIISFVSDRFWCLMCVFLCVINIMYVHCVFGSRAPVFEKVESFCVQLRTISHFSK